MAHLWSQIRRVAPYFRTALLLGERGAGTEAVAQALHRLSPFAKSAFVEMTTQDVETRLTSAAMMKLAGETLFLPEVERLSASAQQSLLRLMRMRKPKQVCVIASATGDLKPLVSAGQFSGVLAQALSGLQLAVVPLRERREDIPALIEHLLQHEAKALGVDVCRRLQATPLRSSSNSLGPATLHNCKPCCASWDCSPRQTSTH